jgi:triosephosphate isomerase
VTRVKIAAGNWKMHGDLASNASLFEAIDGAAKATSGQVMIFAPAVYLDSLLRQAAELDSPIIIGAQNMSEHESGAYTGEISGAMVKDLGCTHVLVGHSERRSLYHETNEVVASKFAAALTSDLVPVLCVGETLEEREADQTMAVVLGQIDAVASVVGYEAVCNAVVAYEPVWAIGTGKTATPEQAQEVHQQIRAHLKAQVGDLADSTAILYGGSVNGSNADELFSMADIDGGLVGGASLKADAFSAICRAAG